MHANMQMHVCVHACMFSHMQASYSVQLIMSQQTSSIEYNAYTLYVKHVYVQSQAISLLI